MNQNRIKKEIDAVKDMVTDFVPSLTSTLLNPTTWQSLESMNVALGGVASNFVGRRIKKFIEEIWQERESINTEILDSEQTNQKFIELIRFVAQENPDNETWESAKKIFRQTLQGNISEHERAFLHDMLNVVTELSGSEIKILAGSYKISQNLVPEIQNQRNVNWWAEIIVENVGFVVREQVLRYEDNLVKQKLIAPRENFNGSQKETWDPGGGQNASRLSSLGYTLAELLANT